MTDDLSTASVGFPTLPPRAPQVRSLWRRAFGIVMMWVTGWRIADSAKVDEQTQQVLSLRFSRDE